LIIGIISLRISQIAFNLSSPSRFLPDFLIQVFFRDPCVFDNWFGYYSGIILQNTKKSRLTQNVCSCYY